MSQNTRSSSTLARLIAMAITLIALGTAAYALRPILAPATPPPPPPPSISQNVSSSC